MMGGGEQFSLPQDVLESLTTIQNGTWGDGGSEECDIQRVGQSVTIKFSRKGTELGVKWSQGWTIVIDLKKSTFTGQYHENSPRWTGAIKKTGNNYLGIVKSVVERTRTSTVSE